MRTMLMPLLTVLLACFVATTAARTVVQCVDADGNTSFRDVCPPGTTKKGEKQLSAGSNKAAPGVGAASVAYPINFYTIPKCDACDLIRHSLSSRGIPFAETDVQENAASQKELQERTGNLAVPTVIIGDNVLSGYNRDALDAALSEAGYLSRGGHPVDAPAAPAPSANTDTERKTTWNRVGEPAPDTVPGGTTAAAPAEPPADDAVGDQAPAAEPAEPTIDDIMREVTSRTE